ncbi:hypothetical protein [Rudanella lutea]|uniref:hypothetical protein n=1 Tax=Rudanella lutea TaxID=451374 RepID=UPI00036B71D0|nr:hypothetical protein [Rudanella lutea]
MDNPNTVSVEDTDRTWNLLLDQLETMVGKRPADLNAVLFLIGIQELGVGPRRFSKEQKQDLLHIATCRVLSLSGYYAFDGYDKDGWPSWTLVKPIPQTNLAAQEYLIQQHVIQYFEQVVPLL